MAYNAHVCSVPVGRVAREYHARPRRHAKIEEVWNTNKTCLKRKRKMKIFSYGQIEIEHLKKRDRKLGAAIDRIGMIERPVFPDLFAGLIRIIIGQQISRKAAETVWDNLRETVSEITPETIFNTDIADIQKCGLSFRKAGYIKGIATAISCGEIDLLKFPRMTDDEIIKKLSSLPGVGIWTAEMFLLFCLCRPDIVSWEDLAIRRGMMNLYRLKKISKEQFKKYCRRYSPYGSVASLYIWALSAASPRKA